MSELKSNTTLEGHISLKSKLIANVGSNSEVVGRLGSRIVINDYELRFEELDGVHVIKAIRGNEVQIIEIKDGKDGSFTGTIPIASKDEAGIAKVGDGLKIDDGVLSVDIADEAEKDNTKPITSGGVYAQIGNINVLLETI